MKKYLPAAKRFHLTTVVLYFLALILGYMCAWIFTLEEQPRFLFLGLHKSLGILIFFVGLSWIIWRTQNRSPDNSYLLKRWEHVSSRIAQVSLLASLIILPLSGVLFQSYKGVDANFFGTINFVFHVAKNTELANIFLIIHKVSSYIITAVLLIHTGGALKHYFINKDKILQGMWKK